MRPTTAPDPAPDISRPPTPDATGDHAPPPLAGGSVAPPAATPLAAISCETALRRLWDYLDGGLAAPARAAVAAHLTTCEDCPPHFTFAGRTRAALAALAAAPPPAAARDESALEERVRVTLRGAAFAGTGERA